MAIRFEEEYDPERSGVGLRPMGRNAAGNRGISLKKGDYVIGAAITNSDAMRDKERDECAAKSRPHRQARRRFARPMPTPSSTHQGSRGQSQQAASTPPPSNAAEKKLDDAWKAIKALDEKLCVTQQLILTVTENGFGKRTDVDEYRLTARGAQGVTNLKATPRSAKPHRSCWSTRPAN